MRRAFTIVDVLVVLASTTLLVALTLPALAHTRRGDLVDQSLANLAQIGIAQDLYALDWNGRQYTSILDLLTKWGDTPQQAFANYHAGNGGCSSAGDEGCHPPVMLGWSNDGFGPWAYYMNNPGNYVVAEPLRFAPSQSYFGNFRVANAKPLHDYVDGRTYSPTWYAPGDTAPYEVVEPLFDHPGEYINAGSSGLFWSSYCASPAARMHPDVMRAPSAGGWIDPWTIEDGVKSPSLSEVLYPNLKTRMIEHHWTVGAPAPCNPAFSGGSYDGCEPYYFNHGIDAAPASLFYDGSTRTLPNGEVQAADQLLIDRNGEGLWSRDTPFGNTGYLLEYSWDAVVDVSHHILTTDGIRGRDTLGADAVKPLPQSLRKHERGASPWARVHVPGENLQIDAP